MSAFGAKEEVKMKTDMLALIGDYVRVKKAGASWMAACPFHNEKTPSLHISPDKGLWYCHGCGEGGDIFGFVMRMEGMDFAEALRHLAQKAGVTIGEFETKEHDERQRAMKVNAAAARWYREVLIKAPMAEKARAYVNKRGIQDSIAEEFLIGYSPDSWDGVIKFLAQKQVTADQVNRAGLASKSDRGSGYYDRFRDRLMFPIFDHNGNVVGFTARVLPGPDGKDPKDEAKYINTSQTVAYDKSRVLYGLHLAKQEIKKKNVAVVVEGNMDVVMSHQAGVRNVVGSSGTSFTADQLQLLRRFCDRLVLSFDADPAGENAVRRSIDAAVAHGFSVRILRLPAGVKDPDDCIKQGVSLWEKAITDAVPYMAWYIALARERTDMRDPDAVRRASDEVIGEVAKIASPVERSFWVREVSQVFDTPEQAILEAVQRRTPRPSYAQTAAPAAPKLAATSASRLTRDGLISRHLLAVALAWPSSGRNIAAILRVEEIDERFRPLYTALQAFYASHESGVATPPDFIGHLSATGDETSAAEAGSLLLIAEKEFGALEPGPRNATIDRLIGELKSLHKARRQRELKTAMVAAERDGDVDAIGRISEELSKLIV